ncbi:MAG: 16S rRNA (cytosine(1402)-N(4))-methyltransferase RsmH [Lachnospiraceae bacterium]|nr:16S rRNA (cytosine(1402)-N(4))-methyltransferase RsmH [Lachnospiraceae bacterium]
MEFSHRPVMLRETVDGLSVRPGGTYLDGTVGGGGHSHEILTRLHGTGRLIGIDQDEEALAAAKERLREFGEQVTLVHANYADFKRVLREAHAEHPDGILLDLGVSSHQLDDAERGFSYRVDAPLDMRMDRSKERTAKDIINTYTETELYRMIRDLGEEQFAKNIAKHIVLAREKAPVETTFELVEIIRQAIPAKIRNKGGHPAKQTFQAVRIELNRELDVLKESLSDMIEALPAGGRIAVITFHSLEDRIVKQAFRTAENPCICPPDFPVCVCGRTSLGRVVTGKPVTASPEETEENPRAKSAKLRIFERT